MTRSNKTVADCSIDVLSPFYRCDGLACLKEYECFSLECGTNGVCKAYQPPPPPSPA